MPAGVKAEQTRTRLTLEPRHAGIVLRAVSDADRARRLGSKRLDQNRRQMNRARLAVLRIGYVKQRLRIRLRTRQWHRYSWAHHQLEDRRGRRLRMSLHASARLQVRLASCHTHHVRFLVPIERCTLLLFASK